MMYVDEMSGRTCLFGMAWTTNVKFFKPKISTRQSLSGHIFYTAQEPIV